MRGRQPAAIVLSDAEHAELLTLSARRSTAQSRAMRARIVLACAEGGTGKDIAAFLGVDKATVGK